MTGGEGKAFGLPLLRKANIQRGLRKGFKKPEPDESLSGHRGQEIGMPDHSPKPPEKASQAGQLGGSQ